MNYLRLIGIAAWVGFLALPLTGMSRAFQIAAITLLGSFIFQGIMRLLRMPPAIAWSVRLSEQSREWRRWRPAPWQERGLMGLSIAILLALPLSLNNYYLDVLTLAG